MLCPNRHSEEPTVMVRIGHAFSYKEGKPYGIMYQFKCPICHSVLRVEMSIIYYKEGKTK